MKHVLYVWCHAIALLLFQANSDPAIRSDCRTQVELLLPFGAAFYLLPSVFQVNIWCFSPHRKAAFSECVRSPYVTLLIFVRRL
ncbi:hypothetical protein PHSY_000715 [Pseudozyma hubeiensis SY62]|uniref:Secreted protein n=1 Tax=Pseudozyma hubeiensis (strain SY62) TaxID=1305764 RepID=R9NX89_PSEHS|nr:hypothetical protein PHSY_000715 [Pseudozyma hubeiensis SY62]GAC93152.1 hypothetical protein PHSY_000715 [Pseudozyma hubeiensis SY62]